MNDRRALAAEWGAVACGRLPIDRAANIPALLQRIALLLAAESERALTAEERLEQMTRERDEARAQLAELGIDRALRDAVGQK